MIQSSHTTIQIERRPIGIGRLHQWWLTRGPVKMFLVATTLAHVQVLCTATKSAMNAGEIRLRLIRCSQIAR
jgi:hypothetical protein